MDPLSVYIEERHMVTLTIKGTGVYNTMRTSPSNSQVLAGIVVWKRHVSTFRE